MPLTIQKIALEKGIDFLEIPNLSFWGKDRHLCIRAVASGFSLYVDTSCLTYHIYRELDLVGVATY